MAERLDRVVRGVICGGIAGLAGGAAKLLGEVVFPPRAPGEPIPPAVAVSRLLELFSGSPLLHDRQLLAVQLVHWLFSFGAGALYGALAELFPRVSWARGAAFGVVLWLATHETLLPWLGLSLPWSQLPFREHLSELCTHVLFGLAVEAVRRLLRDRLVSGHHDALPA